MLSLIKNFCFIVLLQSALASEIMTENLPESADKSPAEEISLVSEDMVNAAADAGEVPENRFTALDNFISLLPVVLPDNLAGFDDETLPSDVQRTPNEFLSECCYVASARCFGCCVLLACPCVSVDVDYRRLASFALAIAARESGVFRAYFLKETSSLT